MMPGVARAAVVAALLALTAVWSDASVVNVEDLPAAADWTTQSDAAGRQLLQLVAGNLSDVPQQTVGALSAMHLLRILHRVVHGNYHLPLLTLATRSAACIDTLALYMHQSPCWMRAS